MGNKYVTLTGWREFVTGLTRPKVAIVSKWLDGMASSIHHGIRTEVPKDTKKLYDSIELHSRGPFVREITEGQPYGVIVRRGSIAHSIYPRFKKALWWDGLAHPIGFAPHPGTQPNPYHERGVQRARAAVQSAKAAMGRDIVIDIAK